MSDVSGAQLRYIALLCRKCGVREPLEERVQNSMEAGWVIRDLKAKLKGKRKEKINRRNNYV